MYLEKYIFQIETNKLTVNHRNAWMHAYTHTHENVKQKNF